MRIYVTATPALSIYAHGYLRDSSNKLNTHCQSGSVPECFDLLDTEIIMEELQYWNARKLDMKFHKGRVMDIELSVPTFC